jgi:hypothetical protein
MPDMNTGSVTLDFKDAKRKPIKDSVRLTFDNFHVKSLNFRVTVDKFPTTLDKVPAFPKGRWTVFVQPEHYRPKTLFLSVPSGGTVPFEEFFFLHANEARPIFPAVDVVFSEARWKELADLLKKSTIGEFGGADLYADLIKKKNHLLAAGLLNLYGRTKAVTLQSGSTIFSQMSSVVSILQDRIYATVGEELHSDVLKSVKKKILDPADGSLHEFPIPGDFAMLKKDASFKSPEKAGNLQLTFAQNAKGKTAVDADVDEAKGIKHAFEVIGHVFTNGRTHPYDIHQILNFFYENIDLGYDVVPD